MATDPLVWYTSYGSNMAARRLAVYLQGGTVTGATRVYPGCRNPAAPRADRAVRMPHELYFTGTSQIWHGAVAFLDHARTSAPVSYGRAWLLTVDQLADVLAQECWAEPGTVALDPVALARLAPGATRSLGEGRYDTLLALDPIDGVPAVTFTAPWRLAEVTPAAPTAAYLAMLAAGIREATGASDATLLAYLAGRPGADRLPRAVLAAALAGPDPAALAVPT